MDYGKALHTIEFQSVLESLQRCQVDCCPSKYWTSKQGPYRCIEKWGTETLFLRNYMFKMLNWQGRGININGKYISHLWFADDVVIKAEHAIKRTTDAERLRWLFYAHWLINLNKTKVMFNVHVPPETVAVHSTVLDVVQNMSTLGRYCSYVETTSRLRRIEKFSWVEQYLESDVESSRRRSYSF